MSDIIKSKQLKLLIHHLSSYSINLTYKDDIHKSFSVTLSLKNYVDKPSSGSMLESVFNLYMDSQVVKEDYDFYGRSGSSSRLVSKSSEFYDRFSILEKYVNSITDYNKNIRTTRIEVKDKVRRRIIIKELKKHKSKAEAQLIAEIKKVLHI